MLAEGAGRGRSLVATGMWAATAEPQTMGRPRTGNKQKWGKDDFIFLRLYLFLERGEGKEEGENHQYVVASHTPPAGDQCATQARALTGNQTCDRLVCRPTLNPLRHPSQGRTR